MKQAGKYFTLIELLLVIAVIAILCKTNNRCSHTVIDPYRLYLYQIRSCFLLPLEMPS